MEKRRFSRIPLGLKIRFREEETGKEGEGVLKDISCGGIFIETPFQFKEGTELSLSIEISETEPPIIIKFRGEVVRNIPEKGFALKFLEIDQKSFFHLKNFIYYNSPDPEEAEKEIKEFLGEAYPGIQLIKEIIEKSLKDSLVKYLMERAFFYSPEKPFVLASGKESPYYLDCRKITLYAPSFEIVGKLFWQEVKYAYVDGVAGMTLGADPIVCAVLSQAVKENYKLEGLLVRKEPKKHGREKQIEGNYFSGMRVVVVEDVVTTGESVKKAISALQKENIKVIRVVSLVDREEGGKENIESSGIPFKAFFTLSEIIKLYEKLK